MSKKVAYVLGGGIVGLLLAFWLLRRKYVVYVIDRNHPFEPQPVQQTSHQGIGIIENPLMEPFPIVNWAYHRSCRMYEWLKSIGFGYVQTTQISYFTNTDNFLDGPEHRGRHENFRRLAGADLKGFKYGQTFTNFLVPTPLFNDELRRFLRRNGVQFIQAEITEHPGTYRLQNTEEPSIVFDARGMGIVAEQIGCKLRPKSGQTLLMWSPPHIRLNAIVGNPGPETSFNIVPWCDVTADTIRILDLAEMLDPKQGGQLVVLGATKLFDDHSWTPYSPIERAIIDGCSSLDCRVNDMIFLRSRKGQRAVLNEGVLDQTRLYGRRIVKWIGGPAGNAYCFMPAYTGLKVEEACILVEQARYFASKTQRTSITENLLAT